MNIHQKYAKLLINYCLDLKPGQKLYVRSSTLAEPLMRELYREGLRASLTLFRQPKKQLWKILMLT